MSARTAGLETSWVRVEGPLDASTCHWCRRWVGTLMPQEMRGAFQDYHREAGAKGPCRCRLEPAELRPDAEDPGCAWA